MNELSKYENLSNMKTKKGLCAVKFCRGKKPKKGRICHKCRHRKHKLKDPISYAYNALRQNAKRRGHSFGITLEYFRGFCKETDYINKKGRHKTSLSIDRINPNLGYIEGNLRVLTLSDNASRKFDHVYFGQPF